MFGEDLVWVDEMKLFAVVCAKISYNLLFLMYHV